MVIVVFGLLGLAGISQAQQVVVTSPTAGTVFSPGQFINVTVSVINGQVFAVQVGGQDIGFTAYQVATPYSFVLTVPPNCR
jgi:hypothetical protein